MDEKMKTNNAVIADFCELLESQNVSYELNQNDENMMRFRTKLPHHDTAPYVLVHHNPANSALSLALSRIALFSNAGEELYHIINDFNADPENFACKMFLDKDGQVIVLTNAILKGEETRNQIEDYLNICVLSLDKYLGKILDLVNNNNNN